MSRTSSPSVLAALLLCSLWGSAAAGELPDSTWMTLYRILPIGSTPRDVEARVPGFPGTKASSISPRGHALSEAAMQVRFIGVDVRTEFAFDGDSLYAVNYLANELPAATGDRQFRTIERFYSARLGKPRVEDEQDDPYLKRVRIWEGGTFEIVLVNALNGSRRNLGWGYQRPVNFPPSRARDQRSHEKP